MEIRFTQAARRHRVGRGSARYVLAHTAPVETVSRQGDHAWLYVGPDERGRELEIVAVETEGGQDRGPVLLVIHVMPNHLRGSGLDA